MSGAPLEAVPVTLLGTERRCTHVADGVRCITRLCRLNPGPDCYVHSARPAAPPRADQEQAAREEFERLMRQQEERISA